MIGIGTKLKLFANMNSLTNQLSKVGTCIYGWLRILIRRKCLTPLPLTLPLAYSFDLVGNDRNSTLGCILIDKKKVTSPLFPSYSSPCHLSIGWSSDEDESIYENEDFKEFDMRLIEAMNQSSSSPIIKTLVDALVVVTL